MIAVDQLYHLVSKFNAYANYLSLYKNLGRQLGCVDVLELLTSRTFSFSSFDNESMSKKQ